MKLALGTVQFGLDYGIANRQGRMSRREAEAILGAARTGGMDTLDTAIAYGDSEQRLGEIGVGGWRVVSKLDTMPTGEDAARWVRAAVRASLERLGIDVLYGLLLHRPQQLLDKDGERLYRALSQVRRDGLVRKIGVSIYTPTELDALCSRYEFDLVQAPLNVVDRRLIDTGWLRRLVEQGTEVHARSVFLQGLLLMPPEERPRKFDRWAPLWNEWHAWLRDAKLTPLEACLCYALRFSEISRTIVGVDSVSQLDEILSAAKGLVPYMPDAFSVNDTDLLDPARWHELK